MTLLSMLFKGIPGDERVYQSDFDGSGWSAPITLAPIVTGTHPIWVPYYDQILFVAWRDVGAPHAVSAARYDGPHSWTYYGALPRTSTSAAPAAAALPTLGKLMLAWKGEGTSTNIHYLTFDSLHWSAHALVPNAATSHTPALATFDHKLHLVYKGAPADFSVYHATFDGVNWSVAEPIPGVATSSEPALATYAGRLSLVWRGAEGDHAIYWSALAAGTNTWLSAARISDFETSTSPSIVEFAGRLHLVWKGVGDDYSLYMANFDGDFWWAQHRIPDVASSSRASLAEYDPGF